MSQPMNFSYATPIIGNGGYGFQAGSQQSSGFMGPNPMMPMMPPMHQGTSVTFQPDGSVAVSNTQTMPGFNNAGGCRPFYGPPQTVVQPVQPPPYQEKETKQNCPGSIPTNKDTVSPQYGVYCAPGIPSYGPVHATCIQSGSSSSSDANGHRGYSYVNTAGPNGSSQVFYPHP